MNPQNVRCVVSQLLNGVQDVRLSGTAEGMNRLNAISLPFTRYLNYKQLKTVSHMAMPHTAEETERDLLFEPMLLNVLACLFFSQ